MIQLIIALRCGNRCCDKEFRASGYRKVSPSPLKGWAYLFKEKFIMNTQREKHIVKGMTALCVANAWNDKLGGSFHSRPEEMNQFMQDVMNRIYTVLLRKDDADFMRKLALYGSLASGLWGEPQEVTGLLESGFVADIDRMGEAEREEGIS
jgi:hypothetical protein